MVQNEMKMLGARKWTGRMKKGHTSTGLDRGSMLRVWEVDSHQTWGGRKYRLARSREDKNNGTEDLVACSPVSPLKILLPLLVYP